MLLSHTVNCQKRPWITYGKSDVASDKPEKAAHVRTCVLKC